MGTPPGELDDRERKPDCETPAWTWLLDGYNVLHAGMLSRDREEWWSSARRDQLLVLAQGYSGNDSEIWVVFDGPFPAPEESTNASVPSPRVHCVFAPSADEWLVARVRAAKDPSRIAVVTADRRVADRARHRGALVVAPRRFLEQCSSSSQRLPPAGPPWGK